MSNRRWFRLVVLYLVSTALWHDLKARGITDTNYRVIALLCVTAYHPQRAYGPATPGHFELLVKQLEELGTRQNALPISCVPDTIAEAITTDVVPAELGFLTGIVCYDVPFWLLRSALHARLRMFSLSAEAVEAFAPPGDERDNNQNAYDEQLTMVAVLRQTLFRLPLAGADFGVVERDLREQWAFESAVLARHNSEGLAQFVRRVQEERLLHSDDAALRMVNVLAFDRRYDFDATIQCVLGEDEDDRPRYVERAALAGFKHIHMRTFGALALEDDKRHCATRNLDRVSLPETSGRWRTARVRVEPAAELATAPLTVLHRDQPARPTISHDDGEFTTVSSRRRPQRTQVF